MAKTYKNLRQFCRRSSLVLPAAGEGGQQQLWHSFLSMGGTFKNGVMGIIWRGAFESGVEKDLKACLMITS
jgi:hypothetical protein